MRKIQLMLFALTMFQFSCEPNEDAGPNTGVNYEQISSEFDDMFSGAFGITESLQIASVVDRTEKSLMVKIEVDNISSASENYFSDRFNTNNTLDKVFYPVPPMSKALTGNRVIQTLDQLIDSSSAFNVPQKAYIKSLSKDVMGVMNFQEGFTLVSSFRAQVAQARELSNQDKILLLEMAAGSEALLQFMENGGIAKVQSKLIGLLGSEVPYGRIADCSVNWRSVWIGAVVGFGWGVTRGFIIGATTGTVAVPVVGTVTGAISGAITFGAVGFVGGAVAGVAGELIGSCFRSAKLNQTYSSCDQAWDAYMANQINAMPADCFIVPMGIY